MTEQEKDQIAVCKEQGLPEDATLIDDVFMARKTVSVCSLQWQNKQKCWRVTQWMVWSTWHVVHLKCEQDTHDQYTRVVNSGVEEIVSGVQYKKHRVFREMPSVIFYDISVEESNASDLVVRRSNFPPDDIIGAKQFYIHRHQVDHNRVLSGERTFELINPEWSFLTTLWGWIDALLNW